MARPLIRAGKPVIRQRVGTDFRGRPPRLVVPEERRWGPRLTGDETVGRAITLIIAFVAGLLCAMFDLNTGQTGLTAIGVAAAAFVLALVRPGMAWASAITVALCLPLVYALAGVAGLTVRYPPTPNLAATLLALLPALGSAAIAVLVRRSLAPSDSAAPRP